jgi:predicted nucleotidyltransferase
MLAEISTIERKIHAMLPGALVYLFGSHARGTATKDSDIDLCVIVPEFASRRMDMLHAIRDAIADLTTAPLDILLFRTAEFQYAAAQRPTLEHTIAREGVLVSG